MANEVPDDESRQESDAAPPNLPPGVKLVRTLRGHKGWIGDIAWSPDGRMLASASSDKAIRLWDAETGVCLRVLKGHTDAVHCLAFDPSGRTLASGSEDRTSRLWETTTGRVLRRLQGHTDAVHCLAFDPSGRTLASGSSDETVMVWEANSGELLRSINVDDFVTNIAISPKGNILAIGKSSGDINLREINTGRLVVTLEGHEDCTNNVAFDPSGHTLASSSWDQTVKLWEVNSGRLLRTLESHTSWVIGVAFQQAGLLLASKGSGSRGVICIWDYTAGSNLALIPEPTSFGDSSGLAFHPHLPLLASVAADLAKTEEYDRLINIWELDPTLLLVQSPAFPTSRYVNAKVVLLGDTGVGKSGLSLVLNGEPFEATESTAGRKVWTLRLEEQELADGGKQTRETLLWDLAGQPGYRVIHQLHLNEVAVAVVVFDARSETDPLAGVRHWERALRLARQRQGAACVPMKKFLVSARTDRGTVSLSRERIDGLLREFGFDGYFETSAKEGWQVEELRRAIEGSVAWEMLPEVSSSVLFAEIKAFLLGVKQTGRLIAPAVELYEDFARANPEAAEKETNLRAQFDTCVGRLENRDLIRRLSFGGYVLLQPELLDAYASALVNAAKKEPDGLGSVAEDAALSGQFFVPDEQKIKDRGQEQLLLHATVEELVKHDLALRESAEDGRYLVFPSEFIRDYEAAPEPKGKALAVTFDGPVQSLYSTLAVRLGHSGLFSTGRAEMWRNAAVFTARAGGRCGLYLHEFEEARGRLVIFYQEHDGRPPSEETRFNFEEFVLAHAHRRALDGTVEVVRFFVCANGHPVPDEYVKLLRAQGKTAFDCPCGVAVSLTEPKERLRFDSKLAAMDRSADRQRDFEVFIQSARGETSTPSFTAWAGGERVTLAVVFTDVVDSTAMGEELKDELMNEVRRAHFAQSQRLIERFKGRKIKTLGDGFMAAFRSVEEAFDYARALRADPGHPGLGVRAGIHIGPMRVEEDDVFGGAVNFAARVVQAIGGAEIWLSDRAKEDLDRSGATRHAGLNWRRHDGVQMKGFGGFTLWSLS